MKKYIILVGSHQTDHGRLQGVLLKFVFYINPLSAAKMHPCRTAAESLCMSLSEDHRVHMRRDLI